MIQYSIKIVIYVVEIIFFIEFLLSMLSVLWLDNPLIWSFLLTPLPSNNDSLNSVYKRIDHEYNQDWRYDCILDCLVPVCSFLYWLLQLKKLLCIESEHIKWICRIHPVLYPLHLLSSLSSMINILSTGNNLQVYIEPYERSFIEIWWSVLIYWLLVFVLINIQLKVWR